MNNTNPIEATVRFYSHYGVCYARTDDGKSWSIPEEQAKDLWEGDRVLIKIHDNQMFCNFIKKIEVDMDNDK